MSVSYHSSYYHRNYVCTYYSSMSVRVTLYRPGLLEECSRNSIKVQHVVNSEGKSNQYGKLFGSLVHE